MQTMVGGSGDGFGRSLAAAVSTCQGELVVGTEEVVDFVTRGLTAYNERDLDRVLAMLHPEVELVLLRSLLDGSAYRGHDGYRQFLADMAEEWAQWTVVPDSIRAVDDAHVLVLGNFAGHAAASGVDVDVPTAWLVTLRDGLVGEVRAFGDRASALRELGLTD